jgi:hypothetical protein
VDGGAHGIDDPDAFVTQYRPRLCAGDIAFEDVKIRAADGGV